MQRVDLSESPYPENPCLIVVRYIITAWLMATFGPSGKSAMGGKALKFFPFEPSISAAFWRGFFSTSARANKDGANAIPLTAPYSPNVAKIRKIRQVAALDYDNRTNTWGIF
jgi:hypothetical protein